MTSSTKKVKNIKFIKIAIINYEHSLASAIIGILDIFSIVNNFCIADDYSKKFQVKILHTRKDINNFNININFPSEPLNNYEKFDLIIVPPIIDTKHDFKTDKNFLDWLKLQDTRNVYISSVCIGAYVLAQAGLLDGKLATSHWVIEEKLKKDFPLINLDIDKLIIEDGNIITAGGVSAYIDLCLYATRKFISNEVSYICANYLGVDAGRVSQQHYKNLANIAAYNDKDIDRLLLWIIKNFKREISLAKLAKKMSVSERTLMRRFKRSTGILPNKYLQKLRVEEAKHLLINTNDSFEYITYIVGYSNTSSFRNLFKKMTGMNPGQYRKYFMVK